MTTDLKTAQVSLPSESEVLVTRSFDAPRALVWRAYVEPELLKRWMGGYPGWTMPVCEVDLRTGGGYRWRFHNEENGAEFGFNGEFLEVDPPSRMVAREAFDPGSTGESMGGEPALVTTTFEERDGVTTVTTLMDFHTQEGRDQALATGMTDGMEVSYKRLDALVAEA